MLRSDMKLAGPGILIKYYSEKLIEKGNKIIFCAGGGELLENNKINNIKTYKVNELLIEKRGIINNIKGIIKLYKIIKDEDIDIINTHNAYVAILANFSCFFLRKKIVLVNTVHGVGKEKVNKFIRGKIIAVSQYVKERLINSGVNEKKIELLENGIIDLNIFNEGKLQKKFREEIKVKKDEILIGSVGMFTGGKGQLNSIKTLQKLLKLNPNYKLVLVGDGRYKNEYKKFVFENKLENNVIFTGKRFDIPEIMWGIDLLLHLSESETFGMVLVEAMAFGKPIVASNLGGIPSIITSENNGLLVNRNEFEGNAKNIHALLNNEEKLRIIRKTNIELVKKRFDINKTILRLMEIYGVQK